MSRLREWFLPMEAHRKSVYISGPMTGLVDENQEMFEKAAAHMREQGYRVCNPHDTSQFLGDLEHHEFLRFDFERVLEADFLVALPGWQSSKGACAEILMAVRIGTKVWEWATWEDHVIIKEAEVNDAIGALYA